jgi:membrane associated rhomboid family serine protease
MESQKNFIFAALWISALCILIFIFQNIFPNFTGSFMLTQEAISKLWQFITSIFLHANIAHLFYNLFALILFGLILEKLIGSKKFIFVYFASGIIANLIAFNFYPASLGASGAIYGIMGCLAILKPKMVVWVYSLPMPMFIAAIIWTAGSILGVFGLGDPTTGHIAHLSGIAVGILYGLFLRLRYKNKNPNKITYTTKINLPENQMRNWEDYNMK